MVEVFKMKKIGPFLGIGLGVIFLNSVQTSAFETQAERYDDENIMETKIIGSCRLSFEEVVQGQPQAYMFSMEDTSSGLNDADHNEVFYTFPDVLQACHERLENLAIGENPIVLEITRNALINGNARVGTMEPMRIVINNDAEKRAVLEELSFRVSNQTNFYKFNSSEFQKYNDESFLPRMKRVANYGIRSIRINYQM